MVKKERYPFIIKTKESYKSLECFEKGEKLICLNIKSHHPPTIITTREFEDYFNITGLDSSGLRNGQNTRLLPLCKCCSCHKCFIYKAFKNELRVKCLIINPLNEIIDRLNKNLRQESGGIHNQAQSVYTHTA